MYIWGHNFFFILCKRFILQAENKKVVLKKNKNPPVVTVTADEIRKELEAQY